MIDEKNLQGRAGSGPALFQNGPVHSFLEAGPREFHGKPLLRNGDDRKTVAAKQSDMIT
jgi:hypothetical protein